MMRCNFILHAACSSFASFPETTTTPAQCEINIRFVFTEPCRFKGAPITFLAASGRPPPIGVAPAAESRRFHLNCNRFSTHSTRRRLSLSLVLRYGVVPHFTSFFTSFSSCDGAEFQVHVPKRNWALIVLFELTDYVPREIEYAD